MIPVDDLSPARGHLKQLEKRFPRDSRRAPTQADFASLRRLLSAAGDVEELARWAAAIRDTDDDAAALVAYGARLEYRILEKEMRSKAAVRAEARVRREAKKYPKRTGPKNDRYIEMDRRIVDIAEEMARGPSPRTSVKSVITRVVRDNWSPALGQSEPAVVARVFARLRPRRVKVKGVPEPFILRPDIKSSLTPQIAARKRGVRKFGRPRRPSAAD